MNTLPFVSIAGRLSNVVGIARLANFFVLPTISFDVIIKVTSKCLAKKKNGDKPWIFHRIRNSRIKTYHIIAWSQSDDVEATAALEEAGFLVPAIRYPTVPRGTARLRISLAAPHPAEA